MSEINHGKVDVGFSTYHTSNYVIISLVKYYTCYNAAVQTNHGKFDATIGFPVSKCQTTHKK